MTTRITSLALTTALLTLCWTLPGCGGGVKSSDQEQPTLNPVPTIAALSTDSAILNSSDVTLKITGTKFVSGAIVSFGSSQLTPSQITSGEISVVVPTKLLAAVGIVKVGVSNPTPGGGNSNTLNFTIGYPAPTVTSFVASSTLINSTGFVLEVDGHGFTSATHLQFGPDDLTPTSVTESHISVPVPDALLTVARVVSVTMTNPEPLGGKSNTVEFSVNNPVPTLAELSVVEALALAESDLPLDVTGTDFVAGAVVNFGPTMLTPASPTSNKLGVTIPAAAMQVGDSIEITVTNPGPGGGSSNALFFRLLNPPPQLNSLSQVSVLAGDPTFDLTLTGAKFVASSVVAFGEQVLTPSSVTQGQMVVNVPDTAFQTGRVVQVKVMSPEPGGGSSATIDFSINNPAPAITSTNPTSITSSGSDAVISVIGNGFVSSSEVTVGTDSAPLTLVSKTELRVTVPSSTLVAAATEGKLTLSVTNPSPAGGVSNPIDVTVFNKANLAWQTVANGKSTLPGTTTPFATFGPASINTSGMAVFKGVSVLATSQGSGETSATTGLYTADLSNGGKLAKVADIATLVPDPNKLTYGQTLAKFGGFPSFPKIDAFSSFVGFNATHPPVISLPNSGKAGSAGIYSNPGGTLKTGVGLFVQDTTTTYPYFANPDTGAAFGAFPASPSVVKGNTLVFKADYLNGTAVVNGIYYRDLMAESGQSLVQRVASVATSIPNMTTTTRFGYFGAPAAVSNTAVFVGYNKKDAPTAGGIYSALLGSEDPLLTPLVTIGMPVPGGAETDSFTLFGDAVSYDGRFVGFWGAWGSDTTNLHVTCSEPEEAMQAFCLTNFPNGYDAKVPAHQGMFVYDTQSSTLTAVAQTGTGFTDFTYWPFVGTLPEEGAPTSTGGGETETEVPLEPPAFVLSPSIVVANPSGDAYQVVFKAKSGSLNGIYMTTGPDSSPITTVLDTTMLGNAVDGSSNSTSNINRLTLEREGMRGSWLVIGATLHDNAANTDASGIYATSVETE